MRIRIWSDNAIVADLDIDKEGFGSIEFRPGMPDNSAATPDIQLDPWKGYIKYGTHDVDIHGYTPDSESGDDA